MKTQKLADTELTVSSLCYGTMQFGREELTQEDSDRLMDTFIEAGGNFFDTAHCYCFWQRGGDGISERVLGDYVKRRDCRDRLVIASKGAHPSVDGYRQVEKYMSPGRMAADIDDSLARLDTETIDLYWLHRDDPRVPVGEILTMLNAEVDRGRIRYFGGSNWTAERLAEANEYAAAQGMRGFVGSQPRWNLACEPEDPQGEKRLEPGVLLALSEGDAAWHESSQLPVMPYAPTANGYFATDGEKRSKTYDTDRGRKRLEVAKAVAQETGATTNQVAIAWLLHQPFPVFPILGTGRLDHLEDAIGATDVSLTDEQMQRLTC